jgi:hypothetical protein
MIATPRAGRKGCCVDGSRFDCWTRTLSTGDRRRVLAGMLGLVAAAMPGRSLGTRNDPDCDATRKRGQACERTCQCRGDYHCGRPRVPEERDECGQNLNADRVCCAGKGDSCAGNDCECCGELICEGGRCRESCVGHDGICCAGGRCRGGQCVAVYTTLGDCQGECDSGQVKVCGKTVGCPNCQECGRLSCFSSIVRGFGPRGDRFYCLSSDRGDECTKAADCPSDWVCAQAFQTSTGYRCAKICS